MSTYKNELLQSRGSQLGLILPLRVPLSMLETFLVVTSWEGWCVSGNEGTEATGTARRSTGQPLARMIQAQASRG